MDEDMIRDTGIFAWWWVVVGALIFASIAAALYFQPWAVERQREINVHSQQYQDSKIREERSLVTGINNANSPEQRNYLVDQFCAQYSEITEPPPDLVAAHTHYC